MALHYMESKIEIKFFQVSADWGGEVQFDHFRGVTKMVVQNGI